MDRNNALVPTEALKEKLLVLFVALSLKEAWFGHKPSPLDMGVFNCYIHPQRFDRLENQCIYEENYKKKKITLKVS